MILFFRSKEIFPFLAEIFFYTYVTLSVKLAEKVTINYFPSVVFKYKAVTQFLLLV